MRRRTTLLIAAILTLTITAPATMLTQVTEAHAQDEEQKPFKIGVLDVSKSSSESKAPVARIKDLLERANGVELDETSFQEAAKSVGLTEEELRSGDSRDEKRAEIGQAVKDAGLDVVILIDVYKKGKIVQVLMLGNEGQKIYESKNNLRKRSSLPEDKAKEILRDAFSEGVPAINKQREEEKQRQEELARKKAEEEAAKQNEANAGGDVDEFGDPIGGGDEGGDSADEGDEDEEMAGPLGDEIVLSVGGFFGVRGMVFQIDNIEVENTNPLIGAGARLLLFKGLSGGKMHVGLDADIAWAPFGSRSLDEMGQEVTINGTFMRGGGAAKFAYALADTFALGVHAGADIYAATLDPNDLYTGHRYIWARVGADILLLPTDTFTLGIHGSALPVLKAETSGGAYGEGDSGFGFEAGATLGLKLSDSPGVLGTYRYTNINISSYSGSEFFTEDTTIKSQDAMHSGMLNLSILF